MQGLFPRLYECPPSYWLSLPNLLRSELPLREPNFLEHARARALRASQLAIHPCEQPVATSSGGDGEAADGSGGGGGGGEGGGGVLQLCTARGVPLVRARASVGEFARALAPLHRVRVLHLEAARMGVGGFDDPQTAASFSRRAGALLGSWCCAEQPKNDRGGGGGGGSTKRGGGGGGRRRRTAAMLAATNSSSTLIGDLTRADRASIGGVAFRLRFRPRLGVVGQRRRAAPRSSSSAGPLNGASPLLPPSSSWAVTLLVNNVFGRAELRRDTACCKYLGTARTLAHCAQLAEKRSSGGGGGGGDGGGGGSSSGDGSSTSNRPVTSVTWHRRQGGGPWAGTCYGIVDATWQPVPVEAGQAEADSARRKAGTQPLAPVPEMGSQWISD